MDIVQLYRDYNVHFVTEGHKHSRDNWVNIECPFCTGNPGYHLGYDTVDNKFHCWRCGGKNSARVLTKVLSISFSEANSILNKYGGLVSRVKEKKINLKKKKFIWPSEVGNLMPNHIRYLEKRDYNPQYLIDNFGIKGIGPYSILKNKGKVINYKHRIFIPFHWEGEIVSFDTRDITGKAQNKYMACPEEREKIDHKKILYTAITPGWKDTGIIVEGPTDVWRMGVNSYAVSGIKYTNYQVRVISKLFKRVPVLFDDDPQAIIQANKLVADLKFRGVDAFRVGIKGDPGGLTQEEANYLLKQLIK